MIPTPTCHVKGMDCNRLAAVEEPLKALVGFARMRAKAGYASLQ